MDRLAYGLAGVVGIAAAALGGYGMSGGVGTLRVAWLVPLGGLELTLDPLSGFFLALIGFAAVPASIYAMGSSPIGPIGGGAPGKERGGRWPAGSEASPPTTCRTS